MKKLTIGFTTYDDYDGVYFTIQAIRMYHSEVLNDIEFIIIDNNPNSSHGTAVKNLTYSFPQLVTYVPFTEYNSTAIRTKIFELATTPYVMCIDCHILLESGAI